MSTGERIAALRSAQGWSQSYLARTSGVSQPTIAKLESGTQAGSPQLYKIARALRTTTAYLACEIDDPSPEAPPPLPEANAQHVTLPVALPTEDALYRAYLGLLMASQDLSQDELARELARRLPTMLGVLRGPLTIEQVPDVPAEAPPSADRAPRRA